MSKKCLGCGVELQDENINKLGYTTSLDNELCMRCFRLKNYGEYQSVASRNEDYINILKDVSKTNDLVMYVIDILNIPEDLNSICDYLDNDKILVINKRDVIPKSVKDEKIIESITKKYDFFKDVIVISTEKNYNIDYLLKRIKFFQITKNVYVIGNTNAGKSSLINKLIKNYSDETRELTISPMPSTTLNTVSIDINEYLTLIDTPGLIDNGSITNYLEDNLLKKINPKKEIRPKTYQIRKGEALIVEDIFRIDYVDGDRNSFTLYMSNLLKVKKINGLKHDTLFNLKKTTYQVGYDKDIVIKGLGFIKMVDKATVDVYVDQKVDVFVRSNLI